jgi:glycosyltransferase involved in cell wall biosynthesis
MNVAVDIWPNLQGGVGRWQRETVKALGTSVGREVNRVTAFSFAKRHARPEWMPPQVGYRVNRLPGRVQQVLSNKLSVPVEWVCGLGPTDVILAMNLHPLRSRRPVVLAVADVSWRVFSGQYRTTFSADQIRLAEAAMSRADHILTLSRYSADAIVAGGVPAARVTVAPLGVGGEFFTAADHADRVRSDYRLPLEFVVYVGGINERKNVGVLVEALERLGGSIPLVVAGPPPAEPLAYWGLDRPWVKHLGFIPDEDVPGLFAAATVKVFPSALEGFGLPLVEAMAAGTVVLAADTPVFREVGGDAASFFDPKDSAALVRAIRTAFTSTGFRTEYQARGRGRAATCTWERYRACLQAALTATISTPSLRSSSDR